MSYIKNRPDDKYDPLDSKRREEERRKKELEENAKKEKEKREADAVKERAVIQSKLSVKKRIVFLKKQEIENLERGIGIIDRDVMFLKMTTFR